VDLTPAGDTRGALVNKGSAECIEIWNLVFIQFNANPDGTFAPLPARHIDTGMGFERVCSIIQGTRGFTEMGNARISNYETDVFRPIFDELERMSGQRYASTLPQVNAHGQLVAVTQQEQVDVAFRVLADHIRTLSFAIADGIQPGNTDRNYVLRRILRRAVRYGRQLGFREPFFYKLVEVLAQHMGDVFPEIRTRQKLVQDVLRREEEAFNKTLDRGVSLFEAEVSRLESAGERRIGGDFAFDLYDTSGFPLDLTELMARERGFSVDTAGFEVRMEEQRARARAAQKREIIELSQVETTDPTRFVGYEQLQADARVLEVAALKDKMAVVLDASPAYAELGGQVGDAGELSAGAALWRISNTVKNGATWLHFLEGVDAADAPQPGQIVRVTVDASRRRAVERHHTVTHLLHWALHEVVSREATQKGSFVGPDKLTFDFSSAALTPAQVQDVERLVNERIVENAPVSWTEMPYAEIKPRNDILQFFGDKYGETVRVVQIGGARGALDGYSMELCGGTHTRGTGEIGLFRIVSEGAIAAGVRRIEAVAGLQAYEVAAAEAQRLRALATRMGTPVGELERKVDALLGQCRELEKALDAAHRREAAQRANALLVSVETIGETPAIVRALQDVSGDELQAVVEGLKGRFEGVVFLAGVHGGQVALVAASGPSFAGKYPAGKLIQNAAPLVGGKGGGRPEMARGAGKDPGGVGEALDRIRALLGGK
jgi:alanyl-tRNA synthetase